jgi:hypothetical protein
MVKLIVKKIDDKTIEIEDVLKNSKKPLAARFHADGNDDTGTVAIKKKNSVVHFCHFSEIEVDTLGVLPSVTETVTALNSFIGSFSSRGGASVTTLPGFVAGKKYYKDQVVVFEDALYIANEDFKAGDEFDSDDWTLIGNKPLKAGIGLYFEDAFDALWPNVDLAAPSTEAGEEQVASALDTGKAIAEIKEAIRTTLFIEKLGINSLIYPKYFRYDKALTVSQVILSGNATGASFAVEGEEYDEETLAGTTVPVGADLIINDIEIAAGYDTGSLTIIF